MLQSPWLFAVAFFVVATVVTLGKASDARAQRRRLAVAAGWADDRGYDYLASNQALLPYLRGEPFVRSVSSEVMEFIEGETPGGHTFCSFLYTYTSSSGDSPTTVEHAIVMVRLPAGLPELSLTREEFGDKVGKFFGGQDIELESDEFNRLFRVRSPFEGFAYAVLHPRMMEWLIRQANAMVPLRIDGQDVIWWREGRPNYAMLDLQLAATSDFIDQIPQEVFEKYGTPPAPGWTLLDSEDAD